MSSYIQGGQKYIQANQYWQLPEVAEYRFHLFGEDFYCYKTIDDDFIAIDLRRMTIFKPTKENIESRRSNPRREERDINLNNTNDRKLYELARIEDKTRNDRAQNSQNCLPCQVQ